MPARPNHLLVFRPSGSLLSGFNRGRARSQNRVVPCLRRKQRRDCRSLHRPLPISQVPPPLPPHLRWLPVCLRTGSPSSTTFPTLLSYPGTSRPGQERCMMTRRRNGGGVRQALPPCRSPGAVNLLIEEAFLRLLRPHLHLHPSPRSPSPPPLLLLPEAPSFSLGPTLLPK